MDHLSKPEIMLGKMQPWQDLMAEVAQHPNVYCKISGMVTEADPINCTREQLRPYADHVMESFGADRVMFGSDWPVCLLAASYEEVFATARALVLESTFTSLPDVAQTMFPLLPVRLLMQTRFNSEKKIANYHGPLLQSHGTADRLIPYSIGRRLFDAANQPKQFVPIPNGDHNDPQNEEYYRTLSAFLDTYPCAEINHGPRSGR